MQTAEAAFMLKDKRYDGDYMVKTLACALKVEINVYFKSPAKKGVLW